MTCMKALKNHEDTFGKLWSETNSLILYCKNPLLAFWFRRNVHTWGPLAMKLQGITQEIL